MIDLERFNRQIMLAEIGLERQQKIADTSVLIVGLGGLGSPVSVYLAAAGIGRLGLCDADAVSLSNLQRQVLYTTSQIGRPKVVIAADRLKEIAPGLKTDLHNVWLDEANAASIISHYDYVVDCCDNFATRYLIDDTCTALGKTWVHGSIGEFYGQVAVFNGASKIHYSNLYPDRQALCSLRHTVKGVLGSVPGVIGAIQANEILKIAGGFGKTLDGRMLTINLLDMSTETIEF
ncbi:MAG: HesA/MoeB/ThiF family protein [Muribaculum sp.]|nr:HesA/MoeB/ThiF family protein [Muribaculaceae bacterium]MCM1081550.1 HesA/MoeB/ThiF family protein [Muribaculum sp.]